jgi:hypothetical protein
MSPRLRHLLRLVPNAGVTLTNEAWAWIAYGLSFLRTVDQVWSQWPDGPVTLGARVALFVHFDRRGGVADYVLHHLAALREAGFSVVVVSNAGRLQPAALAALRPLCAAIVVRRNVGYDFAAMRDGLQRLGLPRPETEMLLLVNDSIYGPFRPLADIITAVDFAAADLWGATESWQRRYHLQSFFVLAGRGAMANPAWARFWRGVRPVQSKHFVVSRYEVGLTQALLRGGARCAALFPYSNLVTDLRRRPPRSDDDDNGGNAAPLVSSRRDHTRRALRVALARRPLNPTAELWRQLLEAGFPYLKRELLRENPSDVLDIGEWREVLAEVAGSAADTAATERDLQRVMRNRAP